MLCKVVQGGSRALAGTESLLHTVLRCRACSVLLNAKCCRRSAVLLRWAVIRSRSSAFNSS